MPFGYLEFSRAKRRELCPHMQARARAAAGGGRPGPGRDGFGFGFLPCLVLFESGLKGMGHSGSEPDPLRSATRSTPDPNRLRTDPNRPPTDVCERIRTARQRMSENRCAVGRLSSWAVWTEQLRRFYPNRCNCWDSRTGMPLPERYK